MVAPAVPIIAAIGGQALGLGIQSDIQRREEELRRVAPGDLARVAVISRDLRAQGRKPVISTDPFTGRLTVSTEDQATLLSDLLFESAAREAGLPLEPVLPPGQTGVQFPDTGLNGANGMAPVSPDAPAAPGVTAAQFETMGIEIPTAAKGTRVLVNGQVTPLVKESLLSGPCANARTAQERGVCSESIV